MDYKFDTLLANIAISPKGEVFNSDIEETYEKIMISILSKPVIDRVYITEVFAKHKVNIALAVTLLNVLNCCYVLRPSDELIPKEEKIPIKSQTYSLLTHHFFEKGLEAFPTLNKWSLFFDHGHWVNNWEEIREGAIKAATKVVGAEDPFLGVIFYEAEMKILRKEE